jgi:hypothetical protein
MKKFHTFLQRVMVGAFTLCLVFVGTYVPQTWNKVEIAEAGGGLTGGSTFPQQIVDQAVQVTIRASGIATKIATASTAASTNSLFIKETIADGIGWALAKLVIREMTTSIVNWINSGFQGNPAFVQDLEGFMLNIADQAMGEYIQELGGPLSFICSPFQLDVQIAITASYSRSRDRQPYASSCTLTGALTNIEGFIDNSMNFEDGGGWDTWFAVTSNPTITPYGSLLEAERLASLKAAEAKQAEGKVLDYGGGFLSSKICSAVSGSASENCVISTPGKVVQEALTFQLSSGPRSLIEADEFNEIIGALFSQLQQQAITGAAGLLGLSPNTGYTDTSFAGGSFTGGVSATPAVDPARILSLLEGARDTEAAYLTAYNTYYPQILALSNNVVIDASRRSNAQAEVVAMQSLLPRIQQNYTNALNLLASYNNATDPNATYQRILDEYNSYGFHSRVAVDSSIATWQGLIRN